MYYFLLLLGAFFVLMAIGLCFVMYYEKEVTLKNLGMVIICLLFGSFLLMMTLPSLKHMLLKEYDIVKGNCVIDVSSEGRTADATFRMPDTDDVFSFTDIPELDAYGKAIPYYCEVTVSKDHMFEIDYKIFDVETRELLQSSD
ncbi:hypothetical protein [Planococcus shixiaomingii]|uniref:hypothetical protein n=1 Tax=Planococcus shixiaomingii TaxID=3058393 RepID=UPI00263A1CF9|nr:hypothetical protein [Planococcus sp. N022]WKA54482.1 hypothetical protein QWY21_17695 [Planococcus sp. N022]